MKLKSDRVWFLETKIKDDCIEIIEHHNEWTSVCMDDHKPYIVIPIESIDDIIFQLLKFKLRRNKL
jgi:hypothetical protein